MGREKEKFFPFPLKTENEGEKEMTKFNVVKLNGYGGKGKVITSFPTFKEAYSFCSYYNWELVDENNFHWLLDIEEEWEKEKEKKEVFEKENKGEKRRETID